MTGSTTYGLADPGSVNDMDVKVVMVEGNPLPTTTRTPTSCFSFIRHVSESNSTTATRRAEKARLLESSLRTLAAVTEIRFITTDEVPEFRRSIAFGFGGDAVEEEGADERFLELFPLETIIGAFDHGRVVATFGSFDVDVTVPGGSLPMAGTTIVTVQPTHRRRGILSEMMRMHLGQAIERSQPIAGLWASEALIYGRFGYGQACFGYDLTVPADRVALPPGPASMQVRTIGPEEAIEILPSIYEWVRTLTPGFLSRSRAWWAHRKLRDSERHRDGASSQRIVVAHADGEARGYVAYRQKEKWENELPRGTIEIVEVIALDDDTRRTLWHFLTNIDLYPNVHWWNSPLDDPLHAEVDRTRDIHTRRRDTLWLRILDVPRALEARTYEHDGRLTMKVTDNFMRAGGTFELQVERGRAECQESTADVDVTLGINELSGLYLGGVSAIQRWRGRRIEGTEDAVLRLDTLFRTARAPFCPEVF